MARFTLRAGFKRDISRRNGSGEDSPNDRSVSLSSSGEGNLGTSFDRGSDEHNAELGV